MNTQVSNPASPAAGLATRDARRRWRQFKDRAARVTVFAGGLSVIGALVLIFVYLFYVVLPLFAPAGMQTVASYAMPVEGEPMLLSIEEQAEIGMALPASGNIQFFSVADGSRLEQVALPLAGNARLTAVSSVNRDRGLVAVASGDNDVHLFRHQYRISFEGDNRFIAPKVDYPFGEAALALRDRPQPEVMEVNPMPASQAYSATAATAAGEVLTAEVAVTELPPAPLSPIARLAVRSSDGTVMVAAQTEDGHIWLRRFAQSGGLFAAAGGALTASPPQDLGAFPQTTQLILTPDADVLYVAEATGRLLVYRLAGGAPTLRETVQLLPEGTQLQQLSLLSGGDSLVAVGNDAVIRQWFPVRDDQNVTRLIEIRQFELPPGSQALALESEQRRRGFLVGDQNGRLDVFYSTSERRVISEQAINGEVRQLSIAPRANTLLLADAQHKLHVLKLHNEHPEVSWSALWGKVWYEGYAEPDYVWQSSSASSDFEAKFSLTPLAFGTLKAAFYAMVIAVPLAIMGAIFTANFMAPRMRTMVKPTIEVMEALPTVILGFLAGLWLAPIAEENLPAALMLVPALVFGLILAAWLWSRLPGRIRYLVPDGWEAALLVPAVALILFLVFAVSGPVEKLFFGGDMPAWFDRELGIGYDQRNALVVGFAMGFAVIPTIFSISEDAIFSVPRHLSQGSLALGATPWQTLMRVVLPTASPGIFSGVMIGMGRAVGETMIVLMATGNTAIMDWSIFEGMRTLSANIAVEMPESEVASTHYRILFLAGLVLFLFTFLFNTLAETVRQRLREKYSSI